MEWLIAIVMGVLIWRSAAWALRILANPPDDVDPTDVVEVLQHYWCSVCGTEVTMTVSNAVEVANPRHCREDMIMVWRPEDA